MYIALFLMNWKTFSTNSFWKITAIMRNGGNRAFYSIEAMGGKLRMKLYDSSKTF